nr:WecB/TagA/CpsF family glycosyltransferase [uncultured Sellimonas sp.]
MCEKIEVLGVQIDGCTAKEAMQKVIGYMETEPINTVEILAGASVVELVETGDLREKLQQMELLVVGDQTLLKLSGVSDRTLLKEAETNLFLKMFLRYMKKSKKRVFLLASNEEKLQMFQEYLQRYYTGLVICGCKVAEDKPGMNDMIVNKINGAEADCILSALPSPFQENFIGENAPILDARIWLGIGEGIRSTRHKNAGSSRFRDFLVKVVLKTEMKKKKKEEQISESDQL